MSETNDLIINGLVLDNHVQSIKIQKQNINSYFSTLRQSTPTGIRSGKANVIVSIDMAFPNHYEIDSVLAPLIAHFKISPFVQLQSDHIASTVLTEETDHLIMAATLNNLSIHTRPGEPESLYATLDLLWFNYAPYSRDFNFKTLVPQATKTRLISDSNLYRETFDKILSGVSLLSGVNMDTDLTYNEYVKHVIPVDSSVKEEDIQDIGKNLHFVDSSHIYFKGGRNKMERETSAKLKHVARAFFNKTGKQLPINNMFLSVLDVDFFYDETGKTLKDHQAGTAFDIVLYDREVETYGGRLSEGFLRKRSLTRDEYDLFVNIADEFFVPSSSNYNSDGSWHFQSKMISASQTKLIEQNHVFGDPKAGRDKGNITTHREYIAKLHEFYGTMKDQNLEPTRRRGIYKRPVTIKIKADDTQIAITGINVSLQNSITTIPIIGYEYPTHQYLGGKHVKVAFSMEGLKGDKINSIKRVLNTINSNALNFRGVEKSNILTISNPIVRMIGASEVLVDTFESSTVPGAPEIESLNFLATEYNVTPREDLNQEKIATSGEIIEDAFTVLKRYISGSGVSVGASFSKASIATPGIRASYPDTGINASVAGHVSKLTKFMNNLIEDLNSATYSDIENIGSLRGLIDLVKPKLIKRASKEELAAMGFETPLESRKKSRSGMAAYFDVDSYGDIPFEIEEAEPGAPEFKEKSEFHAANEEKYWRIIALAYNSLADMFWDMVSDGTINGNEAFKDVKRKMMNMESQSATQCYPDLNLSSIHQEPDYFFWNEDSDGMQDNAIIEAAREHVENAKQSYKDFETKIPGGLDALYFDAYDTHINDATSEKTGGEEYGIASNDKNSRPTTYNDEADENKVFASRVKLTHNFQLGTGSEDKAETTVSGMMDAAIESTKNKTHTMRRAFPAYKLYFIEEDEDERWNLLPRISFDDYFGYDSVQDIRLIKSRKVPADLCIIKLTNLSGKLTDTPYYNANSPSKFFEGGRATEGTIRENPMDSLVLRPGQRIQLRMGYSNNPDNLDITFNGQITEVSGTDVVTIVCQSYATELVSHIKGMEEVEKVSGFTWNKYTGSLLANLLHADEVIHFGTKKRNIFSHMLFGTSKNLGSSGNTLYGTNFDPRDDNIFPPHPNTYTGITKGDTFYSKLDYKFHYTTIWDVLKEMELRHPGWIASPVPYGGRMTMFFGIPSMGYWYRPETMAEYMENSGKRKELKGRESKLEGIVRKAESFFGDKRALQVPEQLFEETAAERVDLAKNRVQPFRNYHFLSDKVNIVANNIALSSDAYNAVKVQYTEDVLDDMDEQGNVNWRTKNIFELKADMDIRDNNVNLLFSQQPNCEQEDMAARYAQGLLLRHLKDVYTGSITILGDASVKPYDTCFISDEYTDMFGPVEVERVVHHFSQEAGFITEITPDLCVSGNNYAISTSWDVMKQFFSFKTMMLMGIPFGAGAMFSRGVIRSIKAGHNKAYNYTVGTVYPGAKSAFNSTASLYKDMGAGGMLSAAASTAKKKAQDVSIPGIKKVFQNHKQKLNLDESGGALSYVYSAMQFVLGNLPQARIAQATVVAASILATILTVKLIKYTNQRQPILIHPLMVNKVPYLSGVDGFRQNGVISSLSNKWDVAKGDFGDAISDLKSALEDLKNGTGL